jgi:hypothetical protein
MYVAAALLGGRHAQQAGRCNALHRMIHGDGSRRALTAPLRALGEWLVRFIDSDEERDRIATRRRAALAKQ